MQWILVVNAISGAMMIGLIWLVQLVHYPAFHYIDKDKFQLFHGFHSAAITIIVMPTMMFELGSSLYLWWANQGDLLYSINAILAASVWVLTFILSVPLHHKLGSGYDEHLVKKLVWTNLPRTIAWSVRGYIIYLLLLRSFA